MKKAPPSPLPRFKRTGGNTSVISPHTGVLGITYDAVMQWHLCPRCPPFQRPRGRVSPACTPVPVSLTKTSTHDLSTSRKHTTGFLVKSCGEFCGCTVLTAACYWPSSHLIPAQKFVFVPGELTHDCSPLVLDSDKVCAVTTPHSLTLHELDKQSQPSRRGCHSWELQDQPFTFCRRFGTASIFSTVCSTCT